MHCLSTQSGHQLNPAVLFFQEIPLPAQIFSWKRKDKGTDEVSCSAASEQLSLTVPSPLAYRDICEGLLIPNPCFGACYVPVQVLLAQPALITRD